MSGDGIREMLRSQPFQSFEVHMSSGDVYQVTHPEQAFVLGASLYIWYPELGEDHVSRCSLLHITGVEHNERRSKKKGGKS